MQLSEMLIIKGILTKAIELYKAKKDGKIPVYAWRFRNNKWERYLQWINPIDKDTQEALKEGLQWEFSVNPHVNKARITAAKEKIAKFEAEKQEALRIQEEIRQKLEREKQEKIEKEKAERNRVAELIKTTEQRKSLSRSDIEDIEKWYRNRIKTGEQSLITTQDQLDPHTEGHEEFNKRVAKKKQTSTIILNLAQCQELIHKFANTGEMDLNAKTFPKQFQEKVYNTGVYVGDCITIKGDRIPTDCFKIHYGKKGAHIVPLKPLKPFTPPKKEGEQEQ